MNQQQESREYTFLILEFRLGNIIKIQFKEMYFQFAQTQQYFFSWDRNPAIVNAWYAPEHNSISMKFSLKINNTIIRLL